MFCTASCRNARRRRIPNFQVLATTHPSYNAPVVQEVCNVNKVLSLALVCFWKRVSLVHLDYDCATGAEELPCACGVVARILRPKLH
jgi:hypothetical protein